MKTRITYTALIQWLTVQAQMEAKNWSKEFKQSVETYYDLMHQDQIIALADINGFDVIEAVLDTDTIGTEQSQVDTKAYFEKVDKELFDVFKQAGTIKVEANKQTKEPKAINGDPLVKESEIKAMLEKAFPNAVVISPSDLKAMGSDIESLKPHSLDELIEGLGLKDLLEPENECTCEACINTRKETETEANTEELAESETFVSSLVAMFEIDEQSPRNKSMQTSIAVNIASLLLEIVEAKTLNSMIKSLPLEVAVFMITNDCTFKDALLHQFIVHDTVRNDLNESYKKEIRTILKKLISTLTYGQQKQIKENFCKQLQNSIKA